MWAFPPSREFSSPRDCSSLRQDGFTDAGERAKPSGYIEVVLEGYHHIISKCIVTMHCNKSVLSDGVTSKYALEPNHSQD